MMPLPILIACFIADVILTVLGIQRQTPVAIGAAGGAGLLCALALVGRYLIWRDKRRGPDQ